MFSLEVVQAISDWQRSPSEATKPKRGERLKQVMATLPPYFRQCDQPCFRQETHKPDRTFQVLIEDKLPESIAGWTVDPNVAKNFKGGVSYDDRSIILWILPPASSVVANLDRLYSDPDFKEALALTVLTFLTFIMEPVSTETRNARSCWNLAPSARSTFCPMGASAERSIN